MKLYLTFVIVSGIATIVHAGLDNLTGFLLCAGMYVLSSLAIAFRS